MDPQDRHSFEKCCEEAINSLKQVGIKFIHSPKIIMKLNHYFRNNNTFPHPNIQVELDRQYESPFLETFPEVKIQIREWASKNLSDLSCDEVQKYLTKELLPSSSDLPFGEFKQQFSYFG